MHHAPSALSDAVAQGWRLRHTDPLALVEQARALRALAGGAAWADLFEAWGRLWQGQRQACEDALAAARARPEAAGDDTLRVAGDELATFLLARAGDVDAALRAGAPALAHPGLSPSMRFQVLSRHCMLLETSGRTDEALRMHYEGVAAARQTGEPAFVAAALGALGGLQSSLLNFEDAEPLCEEAWTLCEQGGWVHPMSFIGPNRLMVQSGLGRHDRAVAFARRLLALEGQFAASHRAQRHTFYACALAAAGDATGAQPLLDRSRALLDAASPGAAPRVEWVWTQARVWNRVGRAADALALVRERLDATPRAPRDPALPIDLAHLHGEAARACETLGDLAGALRHERAAAQAREAAAQQAAQARRLTLQIHLQLDAATRERDRALDEQRRLGEANAALHSANQAKTRFLAAASHDLRQPIHALGLQLAALRDVLPPGAAQSIGQRIEGTVGALGSMFDLLLDLSRMDAGALPVRAAEVDLRAVLVRLTDEFSAVAGDKGLRLVLRLPPECTARTDPLLFERLLRNLIDNAIKYTEHGGVLLALRRHGATQWRLRLWDTGCGIAPSEQARVFDEFYQVGNAARDRAQGLGLGLSIVARLAGLLGHRLSLRSRPGRGSCFTIELPRAAAPAIVAAPPPVAAPTAARDLCVAVIEDDADVRDAMRLLLERWGHRVVDGVDHRGVLAQCADGASPAAVIADDRLPGAHSGALEAQALGDALGRPLPTLIVTGDASPQRLRDLTDAGVAWLAKPVAPVRLRSWLAHVAP